MKKKTCKQCKCKFEPSRPLQMVCSYRCSIEYLKEQDKKKAKIQWSKEKKELKEKLRTKSDYEKDLQININTIVRLIDKGTFCHSTKKPLNDKFDAGHVFSVGGNPTIRFNLFNIYAQSVYANQYLSGDQLNFIEVIEEVYGTDHKETVLNLRSKYKLIKLTVQDLKETIEVSKQLTKELKALDQVYGPKTRIKLREKFNKIIGIYK